MSDSESLRARRRAAIALALHGLIMEDWADNGTFATGLRAFIKATREATREAIDANRKDPTPPDANILEYVVHIPDALTVPLVRVMDAARSLRSVHGENSEYDRALVEICLDLADLGLEYREAMEKHLGMQP